MNTGRTRRRFTIKVLRQVSLAEVVPTERANVHFHLLGSTPEVPPLLDDIVDIVNLIKEGKIHVALRLIAQKLLYHVVMVFFQPFESEIINFVVFDHRPEAKSVQNLVNPLRVAVIL